MSSLYLTRLLIVFNRSTLIYRSLLSLRWPHTSMYPNLLSLLCRRHSDILLYCSRTRTCPHARHVLWCIHVFSRRRMRKLPTTKSYPVGILFFRSGTCTDNLLGRRSELVCSVPPSSYTRTRNPRVASLVSDIS